MEFDSGILHFIKLLLIIGLISMFYMIVMQKIKEQNHKISSLLSLVTTMATEITVLKQGSQYQEYKDSEESHIESLDDKEVCEDEYKEVSKPLIRKIDLCSISDSDSDSDSDDSVLDENFVKNEIIYNFDTEMDKNDSEKDRGEKIEFFENFDQENEPIDLGIESISFENKDEFQTKPKQDYSKLTVPELVEIVVKQNILSKEKAKKLKKKELIELL